MDDSEENASSTPLPFGLPPFFPSMKMKLEECLSYPEKLPVFNLDQLQKHWPRKPCPEKLLRISPHPPCTHLQMDRDPKTGELIGFHEVVNEGTFTGKNSMSMRRMPGPPDEAVRGSTTNYPFLPGGMNEPTLEEMQSLEQDEEEIDFENNLLSIPPNFERGIDFKVKDEPEEATVVQREKNFISLANILNVDDELLGLSDEIAVKPTPETVPKNITITAPAMKVELENDVEQIMKKEIPVLKISEIPTGKRLLKKTEWAEELDTSKEIKDFNKRIHSMAITWDFKLDPFQQQAVLCLENSENIFVAAHTSAGKTVVAEYAIALALQHKMRTVYTSPIKALSNQKYRDFKERFKSENVGLLTGDFQINPNASCLIMTTEILRSMLYKGADTIRDLEWVIFDEVHYVNDPERGVVWEEVVIMLPEQVNIVMLSATVPNYMEFASWVGMTKKKKMYVVSTEKRPVPLEHYLYTGYDGNTMDDVFMIMDQNGRFLTDGYRRAVTAFNGTSGNAKNVVEPSTKKEPQHLKKPVKKFDRNSVKQENRMWKTLIQHLQKNDKLPAVVFVFSRKRCDDNAQKLKATQDLVPDPDDKKCIRNFFQKCICNLKRCDQKLPQVKLMGELVEKGIGIHHSGILPILKEIVEMLFEKKKVKLLFATETFAMGVNMPTRTVVFDTVSKHDGKALRNLLSNEYIQMAGRAGRRKIDKTGTVLIMCKRKVPDEMDLKQIMQGKANLLESKFRLTYGMMLNLMRNDGVSVVHIMKHSFTENNRQRQREKIPELLQLTAEKITHVQNLDCPICGSTTATDGLVHFAEYALAAVKLKQKLQLTASCAVVCGRIVIIHYSFRNMVAVVLKQQPARTTLLVLTDSSWEDAAAEKELNKTERNLAQITHLVNRNLFVPEAPATHIIVEFDAKHNEFLEITRDTLKIEADKIIDNWKKRQIPRFRNDPPNQSCSIATQELWHWAERNCKEHTEIDYSSYCKGEIESFDSAIQLQYLHNLLMQYPCIKCTQFDQHLRLVLEKIEAEERVQKLEFQQSELSLQTYPDYEARLQVLERMEYIDRHHRVKLRGKVACRMSNHEIVITQLLLDNVLKDLRKEEIAALLSCLVFQQKRPNHSNDNVQKGQKQEDENQDEYPELPENLRQAIKKTNAIIKEIDQHQRECGVHDDEFVQQFSFGIIEVVYDWASNKDFAHIAKLTDIQEGIIVRTIQRLVEVLKDVQDAARQVVGIAEVEQKMKEASASIKRDIVFAASLYTTDVAVNGENE